MLCHLPLAAAAADFQFMLCCLCFFLHVSQISQPASIRRKSIEKRQN